MLFILFASVLGKCTVCFNLGNSKYIEAGRNLFDVLGNTMSATSTDAQVDEFFTSSFLGAIKFIKECKGLKKRFTLNHPLSQVLEWLNRIEDPKGTKEFLDTLRVGYSNKFEEAKNEWLPALAALLFEYNGLSILKLPLESLPRNDDNFPMAIETAMNYIQRFGNDRRIYSKSGAHDHDLILQKLQTGKILTEDPLDVALVLKEIIQSLPEPVMSLEDSIWEEYLGENAEGRIKILQSEIRDLDVINAVFLKKFMLHFRYLISLSRTEFTFSKFIAYFSNLIQSESLSDCQLNELRSLIFEDMIKYADQVFLNINEVSEMDEEDDGFVLCPRPE